jgi:hypothetical protein
MRPWGLLGALALGPLLILYVLKVTRRPVRVSSLVLWASGARDSVARRPFQRLRRQLLLLIEVLAVCAFAIALAMPAMSSRTITDSHVAILVDTSASMGARLGPDDKRTRLDEAKEAAASVVRGLRPGADAFVIGASSRGDVMTAPEREPARLLSAIAGLEVRQVEGDVRQAVGLAADKLRSLGGSRRIVLVTDGAFEASVLPPSDVAIEMIRVGEAKGNCGIVRLGADLGRDLVTRSAEFRIFVQTANYDTRPREAFLTVRSADGAPLAARKILLEADKSQSTTLIFPARPDLEGGVVSVDLDAVDLLASDNRAFVVLPKTANLPVVVATDAAQSFFVRAAGSDPGVSLSKMTLADLARANVDPDALVVVEGACPPELPGRDVIIVGPGPGACHGAAVSDRTIAPDITSWRSLDARMRFLSLDNVHVAEARVLGPVGDPRTLIGSREGPIALDATVPGRRVTIIGFDVRKSDWPLSASFVIFVRNAVEAARTHRASGATGVFSTTEVLRVKVPERVTDVTVDVAGVERHVPVREGLAQIAPTERVGPVKVSWRSPTIGYANLATNLASARETNIGFRAGSNIPTAQGTAPAEGVRPAAYGHTSLVPHLALLLAALLALELFLVTRQTKVPSPIVAPSKRVHS